jgi:hypothetical protein
VPGVVKTVTYENKKSGHQMHSIASHSYIVIAGNLGMGFQVFSQVGKVHMSFTTDDAICTKEMNKRIIDMTTENIIKEIENMKYDSIEIDRIQDERNSVHSNSYKSHQTSSIKSRVC